MEILKLTFSAIMSQYKRQENTDLYEEYIYALLDSIRLLLTDKIKTEEQAIFMINQLHLILFETLTIQGDVFNKVNYMKFFFKIFVD